MELMSESCALNQVEGCRSAQCPIGVTFNTHVSAQSRALCSTKWLLYTK